MAADTIKAVVKNHIDTKANLTTLNNIPYEGEISVESDTRSIKVGDGITAYNDLDYFCSSNFLIGTTQSYVGNLPVPEPMILLDSTNQILNILDYPTAYSRIGTKYGGDGITTFALPTIAQARGDEFDTGWVTNSDWTNRTINIQHSLSSGFSQITKTFYLSQTGSDTDGIEVKNASASGTDNGIQFQAVDINNVELRIADNGFLIINDVSGTLIQIDSEAWFYKVVITKDNPPTENEITCIYLGDMGS